MRAEGQGRLRRGYGAQHGARGATGGVWAGAQSEFGRNLSKRRMADAQARGTHHRGALWWHRGTGPSARLRSLPRFG